LYRFPQYLQASGGIVTYIGYETSYYVFQFIIHTVSVHIHHIKMFPIETTVPNETELDDQE
jgi:hypothetical protein